MRPEIFALLVLPRFQSFSKGCPNFHGRPVDVFKRRNLFESAKIQACHAAQDGDGPARAIVFHVKEIEKQINRIGSPVYREAAPLQTQFLPPVFPLGPGKDWANTIIFQSSTAVGCSGFCCKGGIRRSSGSSCRVSADFIAAALRCSGVTVVGCLCAGIRSSGCSSAASARINRRRGRCLLLQVT